MTCQPVDCIAIENAFFLRAESLTAHSLSKWILVEKYAKLCVCVCAVGGGRGVRSWLVALAGILLLYYRDEAFPIVNTSTFRKYIHPVSG